MCAAAKQEAWNAIRRRQRSGRLGDATRRDRGGSYSHGSRCSGRSRDPIRRARAGANLATAATHRMGLIRAVAVGHPAGRPEPMVAAATAASGLVPQPGLAASARLGSTPN